MLIGKPEGGGKLEFAGVLYNPDIDESFEDAARRCVVQELGNIVVGIPMSVGSHKIISPRYPGPDGAVTTLMRVGYNGTEPPASPGISKVVWVPMWYDQAPDFIIDAHKPLAELIKRRWSGC
jgi:hypothetical protein